MNKNTGAKLITCILPKGKAIPLLQALSEKGCQTANFAYARGSDLIDDQKSSRLLSAEEEKEIVTIVARSEEEAESLFDFSFEHAEMNKKGGGIIYMYPLNMSTPYSVQAPE